MLRVIILIFLLHATHALVFANTAPEDAALRIARLQNSQKMQDAIKAQSERIRQKGLLEKRSGENKESKPAAVKDIEIAKPLILIFISSSMPDELLAGFVCEAARLIDENAADVIFLLRGIPAEGLQQFGRRINPENYGITLRVDPFLFGKLEIDSVPIVIVDRVYAILHPTSLGSALGEIVEAGYADLAGVFAY